MTPVAESLARRAWAHYAGGVAKLYFRHGTMSSAKTLNLLAVAHNYRSQGKRVLFEGLHCVLVDEAQFLSTALVEQLRRLTLSHNVPVICYGLRTDFQTRLFEGSQRLLELADSIEEVKVTCQFCNRKAIFNMRFVDGKPTLVGEQVQLGGDESYAPCCYTCFAERLRA
ncbi:MAG: thymidine kinase [Polyangiaceae bacterium]|nr:thymidine kinase [Polyangiaceae bacterium]